ncbi:MAG: hypothetical protein AAF363_12545 [Bacteroidota bacterium]
MKYFIKLIIPFLACLSIFISCSDDDAGIPRDEEIIDQLLTDSLLNIVEGFLDINRGTNPPSLENTYFVSPQILEDSNRPSDNAGMQFVDLTLQVVDQNSDNLTAAIFTREGSISVSTGQGGFVIGEDNNFTIFVEALSINNNNIDSAVVLDVFSGTLENDGIRNFQRLLILTEDFGDPNNVFIEIGESRLIIDSDGFSPIVDVDLTNGRFKDTGIIDENNIINSSLSSSEPN